MAEKKILIIDDLYPSIVSKLKNAGYQVDDKPEISASEVQSIIGDYFGLILRSKLTVDTDFLNNAKALRFIGRAGAGLDQLDMPAINERGIQVVNAPEGNRDALGEHMVGMLLALLHRIAIANHEVKEKKWHREANRGVELHSKTVGIIGYGHMGSAFAEKLSGFGCTVLAYDKYKDVYGAPYAIPVAIDEIFEKADILSLHIPYITENHHMVDQIFLNRFWKPIYFLNSSRGKIVDQPALIEGLKSGQIRGAALDVLVNEKFDTYSDRDSQEHKQLAQMSQVILSPHVAGWSTESYRKISDVLAEKILNLHF